MKFEFVAKHRGIWPVSWICEALDVSRSGFHAWLVRHPVPAPAAMRSSAPESAPASSPAIGRTVRAGSGTIFWPKAYHVVCIASND